MKFGKHIQAQTIPEWAAHYMSYKGLKKIINELDSPLTPGVNQSEGSQRRLQTVKAAFFFQVDRELEKVNLFYLQKEADIKVRLKSLIEKQRSLRLRGPRNRTATIRALREAFLNSRHDLDKLQNFVEINNTGFRKILKKWDKRSKSSTKELYLARQVDIQPCFNQEVIAEFSDTVTKCLSELEHALEEETELMTPTAMPSQLDLISTPLMHSTLCPQSTAKPAPCIAESRSPLSQRPNSPFSLGSNADSDAVSASQARPGTRCSSTGFLVDIGLSSSIQVDRAEAELFQALQAESAQPAIDLLRAFKEQQAILHKTCATRVLWRACSELKDPNKQQMLLDAELADLRSVDDINERTLAHEATIHGSLAILRAAVKAGCDPDEPDYYARRPIHYAAINGHRQCIEYLLELGSSVGIIDDDGSHAFDYAVINGHSECAQRLLQYDKTIVNGTPDQPALLLACEKGHESIVRMLLDAGAEIVANSQGVHPAHVVARAGYVSILQLLLARSDAVDVVDKDLGWTPVFYAASEGNIECIRVLADAGCDLDVLDENGRNPVYFAANEGHLDCVDLLLEAADKKERDVAASMRLLDDSVEEMPANLNAAVAIGDQQASFGSQLHHDGRGGGEAGTMAELDLDSIPSLSLPPPLIPFRVYGHNFLGRRTRIQIRMHSHSQAGGPPISFFDDRDMLSLKLVAIAKPDAGMVPHTVMLPLETANTTFGFLTDDPRNFRLEFFLYPSFGLQAIGKAIALPSLFASASSGVARLPLLDRYLKLVAEVSFEFLVVRPFEGAQLQIGGKVETYWKSTNPGPRQNAIAAVASVIAGLNDQSPKLQLSAGLSNTPLSGAVIGSPLSMTESTVGNANQSYTGMPLVVSSSLAAEHVCVQVQVCCDGVPVVSPRMVVDVGGPSRVQLRISSLTHAEFQAVMRTQCIAQTSAGGGGSNTQEDSERVARAMPDVATGTAVEWFRYVQDAGFTLKEVLDVLPVRLGISIQVLYNSRAWGASSTTGGSTMPDVNKYIDAILKAVYEDSHKNARGGGAALGAQGAGGSILERITSGIYRKESSQRNTIFCSYSPQVCIGLNWKQPNYAVFMLTTGREPLALALALASAERHSAEADAEVKLEQSEASSGYAPSFNLPSHHLSVKEATRFACGNNLLGLMCTSSLLTRVPALINNIKDNGLFLVSFGRENQDERLRGLQRSHGVDAMMSEGVIKYEADDSTEYAI